MSKDHHPKSIIKCFKDMTAFLCHLITEMGIQFMPVHVCHNVTYGNWIKRNLIKTSTGQIGPQY